MASKGYRDLLVWQRAMDLTVLCYRLSERFPKHETYGLSIQLRRSAVSVPSNIAEGSARRSPKDFLRFLAISLGSISEMQTQIELAERLGYLHAEQIEPALQESAKVHQLLHGLRNSLERVTNNE